MAMSHSVNTQAGTLMEKRMNPARDQPTPKQALSLSIYYCNVSTTQPQLSLTWRSLMFSFQHYLEHLKTGSLRKTPLGSSYEQDKCVVFVCSKFQIISLSWPPPISHKIGPILASITSTTNEVYRATSYCRWLKSPFVQKKL